MYLPSELIKKKRNRQAHSQEEIQFLINGYTRDQIPDYQMSAWLMAVFLNGLNGNETHFLTQAMLHSGETIALSDISGFKVDKHSTGGVGDKTSLILGPIVAAAGIPVPMMAGRGLAHTGGTLDKLESIPGFSTQLSLEQFKKLVAKHHICFIGQTKVVCPADKKMYALRDVTATVDSIPLICASIMSKKLAEGMDGLVLDVKTGSGAFMKSVDDAVTLAEKLSDIGRRAGKKVSAFVTRMDEPLGEMVGNALEIEECVAILRNDPESRTAYADTRQLSLQLAAEMLRLSGVASDFSQALTKAESLLTSGAAYEVFRQVCREQGGKLEALPRSKIERVVVSSQSGFISTYDTEQIGLASLILGAGRTKAEDKIDPVAGIRCHKRVGEKVEKNEPIFTLYASQDSVFAPAEQMLRAATNISLQNITRTSLILRELIDPN